MKLSTFLLLLLPICSFASASETNTFYLTDDGFLFLISQSTGRFVDPKKVEAAKKNKESLPAEDFPEGNWGVAQDGFQLSLRFDKQNYTNGEPITATLLLRNVTNQALEYLTFALAGIGGPIRFQVFSESGNQVPEHPWGGPGPVSGGVRPLAAGTQVKYLEQLDKGYDFSNGTYRVCAVFRKPLSKTVNGKPVVPISYVDIKSASVPIKIEDSPQRK